MLNLDYPENFNAETDMNVVMGDSGHFIEVQGTTEIIIEQNIVLKGE